jgi:hypothetical protein
VRVIFSKVAFVFITSAFTKFAFSINSCRQVGKIIWCLWKLLAKVSNGRNGYA